jgi:Type II CAAX prenyl endopeptidase Rce1-like
MTPASIFWALRPDELGRAVTPSAAYASRLRRSSDDALRSRESKRWPEADLTMKDDVTVTVGRARFQVGCALVLVQAIFATIHVPMLIVAGHGWAEIVAILPELFIMGVALAIIYFMTGNLLMAVGAHALADAYMQIPRDATGYEDDLGYLYVALALVSPWCCARADAALKRHRLTDSTIPIDEEQSARARTQRRRTNRMRCVSAA